MEFLDELGFAGADQFGELKVADQDQGDRCHRGEHHPEDGGIEDGFVPEALGRKCVSPPVHARPLHEYR